MTSPAQGPLGEIGEAAAADYLERRDYRILERRARTRCGEIDLVAELGALLVFVEVKTRSGLAFGRPAEAVGRAKRRRLCRAAEAWLAWRRMAHRRCRFDVVEVFRERGRNRIRHLEDAFRG